MGQAGTLYNGAKMMFSQMLGQLLADAVKYRYSQAAPYTGHFDAMGQAAVHMIIDAERVHLGFAAQTPEGRAKHNAVVVFMKFRTIAVQDARMTVAGGRK